jgi:phosphoadenosine phosphosulfate reductase
MVREATKTYTAADADRLNAEFGLNPAEEIVRWAGETFGPAIKFANSFGAEDVALQHIIAKVAPQIRVFTLDTGRLNDETYEVMDATRFKYPDIPIEVMFPTATRSRRSPARRASSPSARASKTAASAATSARSSR